MSDSKQVEIVELKHKTGKSSVSVSLFGATITSWKIFNTDMLWLSKKASLDGSRPIRGGIPIVFPQFGPGKLRQHGFARVSMWEHDSTTHDLQSGDCTAVFILKSNDTTRADWPHDFELQYQVQLGMTNLVTQLTCKNTGEAAFDFTALLHSYFPVSSIDEATIRGLYGLNYIDTIDENKVKTERDTLLTFKGEVDRIYKREVVTGADGRVRGNEVVFIGDGGNCDVGVKSVNFTDIVVWNPWAKKAEAMPDMEEDGWKHFVCVEAGSVSHPVKLGPGESWSAGQNLTLRILREAGEELARTSTGPRLDPLKPSGQ